MDKLSYILEAIKDGCIFRTHWITSVFSAMEHEVYDPGKHQLLDDDAMLLHRENASTYKYRIFKFEKDSNEIGYITKDENGNDTLISLGKLEKFKSIAGFTEEITVNSSIIPTAVEEVKTCYGNLLVNWLCLYIPFGTKIPFQTGRLEPGKLNDLILEKYSLTNPVGDKDPNKIYVDEYLVYQKYLAFLDNLAEIATASCSIAGLSPNPEVSKLLKERMKKIDGNITITDLALIEEEITKLDKDSFAGTEDENFLSTKNIKVNRKKMCYIYGLEEGLGNPAYIDRPLTDGLKPENIPDTANVLRAGSYNRGAMTALGGVDVKRANQIFQDVKVKDEDCGDIEGLEYTPYDIKDIIDSYIFFKNGIRKPTKEEAKDLIGKTIRIRSPITCKTKPPHFCKCCVGDKIAQLSNGIHNTMAAISSREMLLFMKAMHGRSLSTTEFNFERSIRG